MKKRWLTLVLVLSLAMSLLACGGNTGDDSGANQTQAQMSWQEQYDLGIRLLNEGKYEDAILAFQAAINIDPKNVDAYLGLADVYVQMGDIQMAQSVLQNGADSCSKKDRDKIVSFAAQYELTIKTNDSTQKEEDRQEQPASDAYDKMDHEECVEAGNSLIQQGKYEDAIQAFEKAIEKEKKKLQGYLGLFEAYRQMGDLPKAAEVLQRAYERCTNWYDREQIEAYAKSIGYLVVDEQIVPFDPDVHLAGMTLKEKTEFYFQMGGNATHWCFEDGVLLNGTDSRTMNVSNVVALSSTLGWGDMSYDRSDGFSYRMATAGGDYDIPFAKAGQSVDNAGDHNHFEFLEVGAWLDPQHDEWLDPVRAGYANKPATGVYEIQFGDSLARVLEQLGWAYADELADLICQAPQDPETQMPLELYHSVYLEEDVADGVKKGESMRLINSRSGVVEMNLYLHYEGGSDLADVELILGFDSRDEYALHYMVIRQFYR